MKKIYKNAYQTARGTAIVYPLAVGFVTPAIIGLFHPGLIRLVFITILFFLIFLIPAYAFFRIWYDWLFEEKPFWMALLTYLRPMYRGWPIGTDLTLKVIPWATISIIAVNTLLHIILPENIKDQMAFPQSHFYSWLHGFVAFFMHAFIHANNWHLAGNMFFLWVFGSTLEVHIGSKRFLALYFVCLIASTGFCVLMMSIRHFLTGSSWFSAIGASGVISGIMGLFAVRCYFARVTVGMPFLFLPWLVVPVRVPSLALLCLFFALNTAGSRSMFHATTGIDYWAHAGGYIFGFTLGYLLRFHRHASEESVAIKASRLRAEPGRKRDAARIYKDILTREPNNIEALSFFWDMYRCVPEKREYLFGRLLDALTVTDLKQAVSVFNDYYPRHISAIPGKAALRLGLYFYHNLELEKARHCLQAARDKKGPWQAKATFFLGRVFEDMGNTSLADKYYRETLVKYPGTPFAREARLRS